MTRQGMVERTTSESSIRVKIDLDGTGTSHIDTGVPFYDHMLTALSKHSLIDIDVEARGDVEVDVHHTVEDTAICLGQALRQALGDKSGIGRFGDAVVPLDESLARAVVDVSGRPYVVHRGEPAQAQDAGHDVGLAEGGEDDESARAHRAPLVEGTPLTRGSGSTAARSARASALNWASTMWCGSRP